MHMWGIVKFQLPRSTPWKATSDWIVVSDFEPLLPSRQTVGLTRMGQPLYIRARIPVKLQNNYDKNESKIRLFKASCILILMYGCETHILTKTSNEK